MTTIGDVISLKTDIVMGFPQGSILGPLLFINIVNSSESLKFQKIADDTTLNTKININDSINDELAKFYNWLKANKLSLNVNKTEKSRPLLQYARRDVIKL